MTDREQLEALQRHLLGSRFALLVACLLPAPPALWFSSTALDLPEFVPLVLCWTVLSGSLLAGAVQGLRARHDPDRLVGLVHAQLVSWWALVATVLVGTATGFTVFVHTFAQF